MEFCQRPQTCQTRLIRSAGRVRFSAGIEAWPERGMQKRSQKSATQRDAFSWNETRIIPCLQTTILQRDQSRYNSIQMYTVYTDQICAVYQYQYICVSSYLLATTPSDPNSWCTAFPKDCSHLCASNKDRLNKPRAVDFIPLARSFHQLLAASSVELRLYGAQKLQTGSEIQLPKETVVLKILPQAGRQMFKRQLWDYNQLLSQGVGLLSLLPPCRK